MLGLGLLGRGVGDAEFLASLGAQVLVTDKKSEAELEESVAQLKRWPNISFLLGGHREEDFTHCDVVIKSAGVRLDSPEVAAARAAGVPVYMSTALFAKFAREMGARIVGVTGTRGKSTVANMIFHTLKQAALRPGSGRERHIILGGNVRGVSTLSLLPQVQKDTICVLELDSWQLQGFGDLQISPHVAVFTNLMSDHQNYYKSIDAYFADKANIFKFQKEGDVLICGREIEQRIRPARPAVAPQVPPAIPAYWQLQVVGEHNRVNAALAASALRAAGLSDDEVHTGLESFQSVEGRLQFVREIRGVKVYNDNNATTPEATIAALQALSRDRHRKSIILIMGGSDKGLDMRKLVSEINIHCKAVILLFGTGTDVLLDAKRYTLNASTHHPFSSLSLAASKSLELATKGDIILFSPAFASFGMFKNEYDRNDQFLELIKGLK